MSFNARQVLVSEGRKRTLAVMWGVALRGPGVQPAGLVRGFCVCGISGLPHQPEAWAWREGDE